MRSKKWLKYNLTHFLSEFVAAWSTHFSTFWVRIHCTEQKVHYKRKPGLLNCFNLIYIFPIMAMALPRYINFYKALMYTPLIPTNAAVIKRMVIMKWCNCNHPSFLVNYWWLSQKVIGMNPTFDCALVINLSPLLSCKHIFNLTRAWVIAMFANSLMLLILLTILRSSFFQSFVENS